MNIFYLKDTEDKNIDAIIVSKTSSRVEVQRCIDEAMNDEDYRGIETIRKYLPDDCTLNDDWEDNEYVYY